MEFCASGGSNGGDHDSSPADTQKMKKRYHRHTAHQIQKLEAVFKECPHPDEKQRMQLSAELGLAPRQIKFWFQNRRTQMKTQHERSDNCTLRAENDRIRCENIAMHEALRNLICPACGCPPITEESSYYDEQKLRMENAQLKEELDRVSSIAAKYIGRPISLLPPVQPLHFSPLDLTMGSYGTSAFGGGPALDLDILPGNSSMMANLPVQSVNISEMDKSLMTDIAANATEELLRLVQTNEPLWMKPSADGRDILNLESYEKTFPRADSRLKNPNVRFEVSRYSGVVIMNGLALVDMFMDPIKWMELFPTIVSGARTIEVLSSGMLGSRSGSLQLMYGEVQVLSPLIPTREFCFLRNCQQVEQGSWVIVDVSYEIPRDSHSPSQCRVHRLPSGCLIQDTPNGYSKVTWVEHVEIEDHMPIHSLFRDLIYGGLAFGAERWLATLQRTCERLASLMVSGSSNRDLGVIPSPEGKRSMMRLAQRMVSNFCASVGASRSFQRTIVSGLNENGVRVTLHKSQDPGQPGSLVLSAATTIWLPNPPEQVFSFLKDERTRAQWDVLSNGNSVEVVTRIANGSHPGNCISVLRAFNTSPNNMLILQESCIDSSGCLVVYCPLDLPAISVAMGGEDPSYIPLLPSGFTISPDGHPGQGDGASTSSSTNGVMSKSGGSLVTVSFQILVSSLPCAKLNTESVSTVNNLISSTVQQIKAALNCPSS